MNVLPDIFYDLNIFSIVLRLVLALLFGGLIGLERGAERHPAGFRTHILVCVGAALAMITNQYMVDIWPTQVDRQRQACGRLPASVWRSASGFMPVRSSERS